MRVPGEKSAPPEPDASVCKTNTSLPLRSGSRVNGLIVIAVIRVCMRRYNHTHFVAHSQRIAIIVETETATGRRLCQCAAKRTCRRAAAKQHQRTTVRQHRPCGKCMAQLR